jgi:uncharacterized protein YbjT (DUF2867 family)
MDNKILVLGSTGKTGRRVYDMLLEQNFNAIPASRNSSTPFDWYNESTWSNVLKGIDTVYITFQPDLAVPQAVQIITAFTQAAKDAGVSKLVLLSGRGEPEAEACENVIINSGLRYTILRCSFFMQNFSEGFWRDGIVSGEFVIPIVTAREPFLDADDIAQVAVNALTDSKHDGKLYELTGSQLLLFKDTIEKIRTQSGQDIAFVEISLEDYTAALKGYLPDDYIGLIRYLFAEVLDGRNESITNDVEAVLGRKPTSFDKFVAKSLSTGVWER